jgi:hypothetical protein
MTWQPMETAPKDGTEVLLFLPYSVITKVWVGYYRKSEQFDHGKLTSKHEGWSTAASGIIVSNPQPTHWMPLPEFPIEHTVRGDAMKQSPIAKFRADNDKMSLEEFGKLFAPPVNKSTVLRWERGDPPVPVQRLDEVERITGIPRRYLRPDIFGETVRVA